jgi:Ca2+-binding EF-hand superfamily protein
MKAKIVCAALAAAGAIALGVAAFPPSAWAAPGGALKVLDPDKDGTVDVAEAKAAASTLFDQLDHDKDGTLDRRELRGRVTAKELASVDTDKDSTLDKNEFSALVEQRFKAADPDNDGTVDAKELKTPAGRALLRLLVK